MQAAKKTKTLLLHMAQNFLKKHTPITDVPMLRPDANKKKI